VNGLLFHTVDNIQPHQVFYFFSFSPFAGAAGFSAGVASLTGDFSPLVTVGVLSFLGTGLLQPTAQNNPKAKIIENATSFFIGTPLPHF
jgi:hypothetical protein